MGSLTFKELYKCLNKQHLIQINYAKEQDPEDNMDDLETILLQKEQTAKIVDEMLPKIQKKLDLCISIRKSYCDWNDRLLDHKDKIMHVDEFETDDNADLIKKISGLNAQLEELKKEKDEYYKLISDKAKEVNDKVAKVEKWEWVPFYNLSLLSSYNSSLDSYNNKLNSINDKIRYIQDDIDIITDEISQRSTFSDVKSKLITLLNQENRIFTDRHNVLNKTVAQWNEFNDFFTKFKSDMTTLDDVSVVLASCNTQLQDAIRAEESIDFTLFEPQNIFAGLYGLKKTSQDLPYVYRILTLSNGKNILMNKYNYLWTVEDGHFREYSVRFENNAISKSQLFDIVKCDEDSLYELRNDEIKSRRFYFQEAKTFDLDDWYW